MITIKQLLEEKSAMEALEQELFLTPELGFKEFNTQSILKAFLIENGCDQIEDFGLNGFAVTIGQGSPVIGLIAELDALMVPDHPTAKEPDFAAHSCGHHMQCVIMAFVAKLLNQIINLSGCVKVFFVAAEEYVDLEFRRNLIQKGEIYSPSGKRNLIYQGAFDDLDVVLSCHTMGATAYPQMELNASLSGFVYKRYQFLGNSSHAAVAPHLGINALNAQVLTQNAIALLRETFQEKDMIRVHLMTTLGGQSVNAVPSQTILEGYIKAINFEVLSITENKIDNAAVHCAAAIGAECQIETTKGFYPLDQSRALSNLLRPHMITCVGDSAIIDEQKSFAAGDLGDISLFKPTIQFGFSGCKGTVHGRDFMMENSLEALIYPVFVLHNSIMNMLNDPDKIRQIKESYKPKMSKETYFNQ